MSTCDYCGAPLGAGRVDRRYCTGAHRTAALRQRQASRSRDGQTQVDRVLRLLRQRGRDGVDPTDFAAPHVRDGGKPIMRLAARINDLRARGFVITTSRRGAVASYVLVSGPALPEPAAPAPGLRPLVPATNASEGRATTWPGRASGELVRPSEASAGRLFDRDIGAAPPVNAIDPQEHAA